MNLFERDPMINLLPSDGEVVYHGQVLSPVEASRCFEALMAEVPWRNDEVVIFGKRIVTARKVAWYGDEAFAYTYSGTTRQALPWTNELLRLKGVVESRANATFNSCLINLYHRREVDAGARCDDCFRKSWSGAKIRLQAQAPNRADHLGDAGARQSFADERCNARALAPCLAKDQASD